VRPMTAGLVRTLRVKLPGWDEVPKVPDDLPVAVWEIRGAPDMTGRVSYLNRAAEQLFGLSVKPGLGASKFWDEVVHPADRDQLISVLWHTWTSGKRVATRVRCQHANGDSFRAQIHATPIKDAEDRIAGVRGVVVDISQGQRRVHRRLADADILGVLHWNPAGQVTGANDVFLSMLGYTRDDFAAGRIAWDRLTPPEYVGRDHTARAQLLQCGATTPSEKEFYHRDGSRVDVLVGSAAFDDASGDGVSCVLNLTPYKCRVREEQTLASLSQYALAADSSSILPFATPNIRYALRADAAVIFARDQEAYRVAACDGLLAEIHAAFPGESAPPGVGHWDLGLPAPWMDLLTRQGMVAGATVSIREERGVELVVGVYSRRPRSFSPDELTFLQAAANLLSSALVHKQTAEALAAQEQRAQQNLKLEALGRLAGGIAHDFNNLLTAILGYADLALDKTPESGAELEQVRHAAESAAELVRQLLAFSRQQVLAPRQLDLGAVVSDVERILRRCIPEDIELVCTVPADAVIVNADPVQLEQVVMNLILNARDAIDGHGRITVEVAVVPGEPFVQLEVRDNGSGMDDATRGRIFEPFFTTKELGKGTGLGLATVYGIVQQSGGTITVQSAQGRGTVFTVRLPLVRPPYPCSLGDPPSPPSFLGTEAVLLVEDEDHVRQSLAAGLGALGYQVLQAASPADAIEIASSEPRRIDALVTDVVMPFMNGEALATRVRALRPNIRTLFISGYPVGAERLADQVIAKPFHCRELAARLRETFDLE
jgi:PAS domain S-box-containing protein